ncbi:hypothetical protein [Tenacibaculum sp.]|uniref:hypothetical protein n=1 Tax=Tenacibaculum sp. TaxID=1906242 RepID=UPI003AA8AD9F
MKTKIKITVIAITGFVLTIKAQTGEGDNYFNGNNFYKGISWQAIKSRFYSYGGNGSEAKWLLHNIPEQGGRFVVVAGPVGQTGNSNVAFSIEGNKSALFTGNVGIGITSPDKQLTVNSQIKILKSGDARTSGDKAELIFGEKDSDSYSGNIRIENTNSNPGYVNPKMVFSLQDYNSSTLDKVIDRMTILPNGNVGIGTSSPAAKLHIQNGGQALSFLRGSNTSGYTLDIGVNDDGVNFTNSSSVRGFNFHNVNGDLLKISHNGNAALNGKFESKEIKVTNTPTADFVFEESYNLPTLESVENHIKEKRHLPEIASAKEMKQNGVNVGSFQIQLLQKIEELTLYTIAQEKKLQSQNKEIELLKGQQARIEKLDKENKVLKALLEKVNRLEKLIEEK